MAYGFGYGYGSLAFPDQIFVTALRPLGAGIPTVAGYAGYTGGYGVGSLRYIDMSEVSGPVLDSEIYKCVADTAAAGITPWTAIES
jgi:hypothetical protein